VSLDDRGWIEESSGAVNIDNFPLFWNAVLNARATGGGLSHA
jgi:hypothetical protein